MKTNAIPLFLLLICAINISSCRYKNNDPVAIDSLPAEIDSIEIEEASEQQNSNNIIKESRYAERITLKEYVDNLRNNGMNMFHIEGDNVLIFSRWDEPTGGNADSQAQALYRQAKAAHVYNIKTVRIIKMPEKKIVGRYVSRK